MGLVLVRVPPAVRAGVGQLRMRLDGVVVADADLAVCAPCRRAVLEQVRVDEAHRRLGYGRVLVAAALAVAPPGQGYDWSTTTVLNSPATRAFWAAVGWPGQLGRPDRCTDMVRAVGEG
ncbi:hypothetical protein BU204_18330 [Actinophytocola xanthii]|uniref:N-acetyltransferase domain-containing protein n=1 Tax=Actinophytocola xanthii TaxID=1912961 RepID=A0A1Q8CP85_9PSEU|nr:hypothetical protein BU204_18330 [Actinophytocola xanthii]